MKFSALNRETSDSSILSTPSSKKGRPTQEAQESACLKLYHNAMKLQQEGKLEEAKAIYCEILESEVMEVGGTDSAPLSGTITRLKFLIYKNVASIAKEQGDLSAAVDAYIEATEVDGSDVTVWCQLASMASQLGNLLLTRKSLEQALTCHSSYWPAIEGLCTVLYALGDFLSCLHVVTKGLELEPRFPRGLVYLKQIALDSPELLDLHFPQLRIHLMTPQPPEGEAELFLEEPRQMWRRREALNGVTALREDITPPKKLDAFTLWCLGNCLLALYKHCKELSQKSVSYNVPVDLSQFIDVQPTVSPAVRPSASSSPAGKGSLVASGAEGGSSSTQSSQEGGVRGRGVAEEGRINTRREAKRKLYDALEPFTPKRRSSRMLTKRKEKDHRNYFEMLSKYLPSWLGLQELPEISDFSPLKKPKQVEEDEQAVAERKRQVSTLIDSTPYLFEKGLVTTFLNQYQNNYGVIQLVYQFLILLALNYKHKWRDSCSNLLSRLFVELYECLHHHLTYPSPFCSPVEAQNEKFQRIAMLALCYVEMYIDTLKGKKRPQLADSAISLVKGPRSFLDCLTFIQYCDGMIGRSALEKVWFTLRVRWCTAKWLIYTSDQDSAIQTLGMCKDLLQVFVPEGEGESATLMVHLPNCMNGAVISLDHVAEQLRELEQSVSLKQIRELFDNKEYSNVVQKLEPFLEYNISIPTDFLLGTKGASAEVTNLSLLLDSLLHLHRHYQCLQTAVQATLQLLHSYHIGNDLWVTALRQVFRVLDKCLGCPEGREALRGHSDLRLLKRLTVCCLKAMDVTYDTDYFLSMPICLPWKILFIVISNDWNVVEDLPIIVPPPVALAELQSRTTSPSPSSPSPTPLTPGPGVTAQGETTDSGCGQGPAEDHEEPMDTCVPLPPDLDELSHLMSVIEGANTSHSSPLTSRRSSCSTAGHTPAPQGPAVLRGSPGNIGGPGQLSVPLQFLCEAHRHLGKMGWCCKDSGAFLLECVDTLRRELQVLTKLPPEQRETLLLELEQCYYCLYGYPHKRAKVRGLVEHNSDQIPLKWEAALMLIEHYRPVPIPSIDDGKSPQVTAEVIGLYRRIIDIIPDYGQILSKEMLEQYLEGKIPALTDLDPPHHHSSIIADVFYILADDALKSMDNLKAIRYYQDNLCYCPDRFDSWAGLALGRSRIILDKLNMRNFKSGMEKYVSKHTTGTKICFERAIQLNSKHCYIIEKFGLFCYAVQSFASQILRQPNLFVLSSIHPWAAATRQEMLKLALKCFTEAVGLEGVKHAEPWIYHWMLAKIGYKLKHPIKQVLGNLVKSAQILYDDGAEYPEVVEISSKLHAVEAVEVHYQLHSIALKCLLQFHPSPSSPSPQDWRKRVEMESCVAEALMELKGLPFCDHSYPALWEWTKDICAEAFPGQDSKPHPPDKAEMVSIVPAGASVSVPSVSGGEKAHVTLLQLCLYGTAICCARFPAFFKPLYRMASTLYSIGLVSQAKEVLLGPLPAALTKTQEKLQPLFVLKSNIFTNMWQIYSEEINRPGNFSTHARRNLELLLRVLTDLKDAQVLLQLAQHLKTKPDTNKQYLRDNERVSVYSKAVKLCVQVLVELSKQEQSLEQAERYKTIATTLRGMANKLGSGLIKELDQANAYFQTIINLSGPPVAMETDHASSDSELTTPPDKLAGQVTLTPSKPAPEQTADLPTDLPQAQNNLPQLRTDSTQEFEPPCTSIACTTQSQQTATGT